MQIIFYIDDNLAHGIKIYLACVERTLAERNTFSEKYRNPAEWTLLPAAELAIRLEMGSNAIFLRLSI